MGPVQRLDRAVSASAEAQRLALRAACDIVGRACGQAFAGCPGLEQLQGFQDALHVDLHTALEAIDLAPPPAFHRRGVKPPDPEEHVDRADLLLAGKRKRRRAIRTMPRVDEAVCQRATPDICGRRLARPKASWPRHPARGSGRPRGRQLWSGLRKTPPRPAVSSSADASTRGPAPRPWLRCRPRRRCCSPCRLTGALRKSPSRPDPPDWLTSGYCRHLRGGPATCSRMLALRRSPARS